MDGLQFRDFVMFAVGAVIGSLVTKHMLEKRYENDAEERVEATRRSFKIKEERLKKLERIHEKKIYEELTNEYGNEPDPAEKEHPEEDKSMLCEIISLQDFDESMTHYDKITLTFYEGDGTLVDEREEMIDDIERTIGPDALDNFGNESKDEDIVYVRNWRLATDFEVVRVEGSYKEQLGDLYD